MSRRAELALALALLLPVPESVAQGLFLEGGLSAAGGNYVYTQWTKTASAGVGVSYSGGRVTARATLPYFVRDTRFLTPAGLPPETIVEDPGPPQYDSSWGDPMLQVHVALTNQGRTALSIGGLVKVPTLEAGDFGTGGWDFGGALSVSRLVGSSTLVGLDAVGWHLADPPDIELRDSVTGTVTLGRAVDKWTIMGSLSGGRSVVAGYADPWWVGLLFGRSYSGGMGGVSVTVGLTETAPAVSVGLVWNVRLAGGWRAKELAQVRAEAVRP